MEIIDIELTELSEIREKQECCSICLEDLTLADNFTTKCNHTFHIDCINEYSVYINKERIRCPLCNTEINSPIDIESLNTVNQGIEWGIIINSIMTWTIRLLFVCLIILLIVEFIKYGRI